MGEVELMPQLFDVPLAKLWVLAGRPDRSSMSECEWVWYLCHFWAGEGHWWVEAGEPLGAGTEVLDGLEHKAH
jgi:hypothetical protein